MSPTNSVVISSCCPLCPDKNNAGAQFSDRPVDKTVVKTSCQPKPHTYHLGCITKHFENPVNDKKCTVCSQEPLPLLRADGTRFVEDSPYCESSALEICRRGDVVSLERLLTDFPQAATMKFRSALTGESVSLPALAASLGHTRCLKTLINQGEADLSDLIDAAALGRHDECMDFLIDSQMKVMGEAVDKVSNYFRCTDPLCEVGMDEADGDIMLALRRRDSDGLQAAIEHGGRDLYRYALFCAVCGDAGCMKVLINNGAQVGISLLLAVSHGHADVMQVVLDKYDQNSFNVQYALLSTAGSGNSDCLKCLLERIEDIGLDYLHSALELARIRGHAECVEFLNEAISRIRAQKTPGKLDMTEVTAREEGAWFCVVL